MLTVPHKEIPTAEMLKVMKNTSKNLAPAFRNKLYKYLSERIPKQVPAWLFLDIYANVVADFTQE